jgi:hypothetical protein
MTQQGSGRLDNSLLVVGLLYGSWLLAAVLAASGPQRHSEAFFVTLGGAMLVLIVRVQAIGVRQGSRDAGLRETDWLGLALFGAGIYYVAQADYATAGMLVYLASFIASVGD